MNREEAVKVFEEIKLNYDADPDWGVYDGVFSRRNLTEILDAYTALRGPQPDPITGLVPCGCGCNPELRAEDWGWYQVYCTGCDMHGGNSQTPDNVIEEWNEAMGYKGGAE